MQYKDYKVEDFLFDEFFVRWVKNPGPEAGHFWNEWIENHPDRLHIFNEAIAIIKSIEPKHKHAPTIEEHNVVLENILKHQKSWTQLGYNKRGDRLTSLVKIAAVIILLLCFGGIIAFMGIQTPSDETPAVSLVHKQNELGQKSSFTLEDGTKVKLNSGSKLTYLSSFDTNERKVILEGEAYFEVTRDENRPFIVETTELTTTVLGTAFSVRSYQDDEESLVAVASGKVKVMKSHDAQVGDGEYLLLAKNQMVAYNSASNSLVKTEMSSNNLLAWKDNVLVFDHAEFDKVILALSRWYGVEFEISKKERFKGTFTGTYNDASLELVLEGLKDQYDFQLEIEQENIIIY